jgi:hypothetical protein
MLIDTCLIYVIFSLGSKEDIIEFYLFLGSFIQT